MEVAVGSRIWALSRACVMALAASAAFAVSRAQAWVALPERAALTRALAEQLAIERGEVNFFWGPSGGSAWDYAFGRPLLVTAPSAEPHGYLVLAGCAEVAAGGRAVRLRSLREVGRAGQPDLFGAGSHVGFATTQPNAQPPAFTVLQLSPKACLPGARWFTELAPARSFQLEAAPSEVTVSLSDGALSLTAPSAGALRVALVPFDSLPALQTVALGEVSAPPAPSSLDTPLFPDGALTLAAGLRTLEIGALEVELFRFRIESFEWRILPGALEPYRGERRTLTAEQEARAWVAIGLGRTTLGTRYGLGTEGQIHLPLRLAYSAIKLTSDNTFLFLPSGRSHDLLASESVVELPLLLSGGKFTDHARGQGQRLLRGGLCLGQDKQLFVALGEHDSAAAVADALAQAGCNTALELDRGARQPSFVHRRGAQGGLRLPPDASVLVGLEPEREP